MAWLIDGEGLVECDCRTGKWHGEGVNFKVVVNERFEVVNLECSACGQIYDTSEFKEFFKQLK